MLDSVPGDKHVVEFDGCSLSHDPSQQRHCHRLMTNDARLAKMFWKFQCCCSAAHLAGSDAQPTMLDFAGSRDILANWMSSEDERACRGFEEGHECIDGRSVTWAVEEGAASGEDSDLEQRDQPNEMLRPIQSTMEGADRPIIAAEKAMVQRAHANFGHPPSDLFEPLGSSLTSCGVSRRSSLAQTVPHILDPVRHVVRQFLEPWSSTESSASTPSR